MENQADLNFEVISEIPFSKLLDHLNMPFEDTGRELKTDRIIVDKEKNLFYYRDTREGGSVINYMADLTQCDLRTAARMLKQAFLNPPEVLRRDIPALKLKYCQWLEDNGISEKMARDFGIGRVGGRSPLSGCVVFRLHSGEAPAGYVGYHPEENRWIFPQGWGSRNLIYNLHRASTDYIILVPGILECLHVIKEGYPFCVALMADDATEEQVIIISSLFRRVLVIHPAPDSIAARLSRNCFVKTIPCENIRDLGSGEIKAFF